MKKFLAVAGIAMLVMLSSFNFPSSRLVTTNLSIQKADVLDLGYFVIGSQEYHAYGNPASGRQITQLWATDNSTMTDSVQITSFSGTWGTTYGPTGDGLGVKVVFNYNGSKNYNGIVYF